MKTKSKALLLTLCAVLLVTTSIVGTMAYLTAHTDEVKNTFTVGRVAIDLDETKTGLDGVAVVPAERTTTGNEYKLVPGSTYTKDPTVTVKGGSEDCYVRMHVAVKNIDKLKEAFPDGSYYGANGVFLLQKLVGGWDSAVWKSAGYADSTALDAENKEIKIGTYEFRYASKVDSTTADLSLPALFASIILPGDGIGADELALLDQVEIVITADAIQADNFADADAAWAAFK